ncbi:MAG: hypothetical protein JW774_13445 [Candidatus Aureabacteria bacterium]|nr:hypothetical protein [Candidatus Auribacterota bacterium]
MNDQLIELLTDAGRTEQADTALYEQYLTISQEEVTLLGRIKGQGKEIDPNLLAQYKTTHEECRKLYSQFIALTGPNRATVIAYQKALNCALTIRNLCEPYKNDLDRTKRRAYTDAVRNVEAVVTHIRRANELAGENAAAIADIFLEEPIPSRATMAHETSSSAAMAYIDLESTQKANERYQEIVAQVRDAERSLEEARQAIAEDTRLLEDLTRFQKQIEEMIQSGEVLSAELRENLDNDTSVKAWQTAHEQANQAHMLEASSKINLAIQATRSYGISQDPDKLQLYESVNMLDKQNRALFDGGERMAQGLNATARLHLLRNLIREREYQLRYQTLLSMIEVKAEGLSFPLSLDEQGQDYIDLLLQLPSLASAWLDANEKTLQSAKKINEAGIIADAVQRQKSFWTDQSVLFAQAKKIVELAKLSDEAANKYEGELTAAIEQNPPEVGEKAVQYRRTVYNTLDLYNTAKLYLQTLVQYATSQTAYADDPELNALREAVANPGTAVRNYTFRFVNLPSVDAKRRAEAAEKLMPPDQLMEDARQAVQKAQAASEKDAQLLASLNRDTASEKTFREQWNSNTWYGYLVMLRFDATEWQKANTDANRAWQEAERKIKVAQEAVATYLRSPEPAKAGLFQAVQELSQTSSAIADIAQRKTKGEAILAKIPFLQALQQELARQAEYTAVLSQVVSGTQALSFPLQADAVNRDYIDHLMQLLDAVKAWLDANQETLKLANEIIDPAEEKVIGETQQRLNDFWTDNSLLFATAMNIMDQAKNAERAAEEYRVDLAIAQSSWAAGADELGNKCRATVSNALVLWKTAKEYLETILTYAGLDKSQYDTSDVTSIKMPLREPENPITEVLTNEIAVAIERMESIAQQLTTTVAPSSEAPATAPPPLAPPSPPSPPVQPPTAPPVDPNAAIDQTPQFQERVDRSREQAALTPAPDVDPVRTAQLKKAALHPAARTAVQLITGKFITALMKFAVPSTRGSDTELRQLIEATKAEMDRCFKEGGQELTETESMLMFRTLFGTYISQLAPNLADLLTHLQEYLPQPPQVPAPDLHPPSATAA